MRPTNTSSTRWAKSRSLPVPVEGLGAREPCLQRLRAPRATAREVPHAAVVAPLGMTGRAREVAAGVGVEERVPRVEAAVFRQRDDRAVIDDERRGLARLDDHAAAAVEGHGGRLRGALEEIHRVGAASVGVADRRRHVRGDVALVLVRDEKGAGSRRHARRMRTIGEAAHALVGGAREIGHEQARQNGSGVCLRSIRGIGRPDDRDSRSVG